MSGGSFVALENALVGCAIYGREPHMDREITLCLTYFILRPDAFLRCDACHYKAQRKDLSLSLYIYIYIYIYI